MADIQPYQYEPAAPADNAHEAEDDTGPPGRLGHTEWCSCGHCQTQPSAKECLCCREIPEVSRLTEYCITQHPGFAAACLNPWVLEIAYTAYCNRFHPRVVCSQHETFRFMAYRQFVTWCWGYLGRHHRVPLPSCVVSRVRKAFPSDGDYRGFQMFRL